MVEIVSILTMMSHWNTMLIDGTAKSKAGTDLSRLNSMAPVLIDEHIILLDHLLLTKVFPVRVLRCWALGDVNEFPDIGPADNTFVFVGGGGRLRAIDLNRARCGSSYRRR